MSEVFPNIYVFHTSPDPYKLQNIILVATKSNILHTKEDIRIMQQHYKNQIKHISNNSNANGIEYTDYMYETRHIKTNYVPLLTDQLAPVENLLNPITNEPYNMGKETPTNQKVDPFSVQAGLITFVLPAMISLIWILYMQNIWRTKTSKIEEHLKS